MLAGIVNRMDRAYVSPENCGEVRLIYRLTRIAPPGRRRRRFPPRLPMTLNIVLKARGGADRPAASPARRSPGAGSRLAS